MAQPKQPRPTVKQPTVRLLNPILLRESYFDTSAELWVQVTESNLCSWKYHQ